MNMKRIFYSLFFLLVSVSAMADTTGDGYYLGDLTGDNKVTIADLAALVGILDGSDEALKKADEDQTAKEKARIFRADVNEDNRTDLKDVQALVNIILGGELTWRSSSSEYGEGTEGGEVDSVDKAAAPRRR